MEEIVQIKKYTCIHCEKDFFYVPYDPSDPVTEVCKICYENKDGEKPLLDADYYAGSNKSFGIVNVRRSTRTIQTDCTAPDKCKGSPNRWHMGCTENLEETYDFGWYVYLDHQCDDWEIGKKEDAKDMIKDLQDVIKHIESYE